MNVHAALLLCTPQQCSIAQLALIKTFARRFDEALPCPSPGSQRKQRFVQRLPEFGEFVIDAWWDRREGSPAHQPIALERTKRCRQHLVRDTGDLTLQRVEPHDSLSGKSADDQDRPLDRKSTRLNSSH